MSLTYSNNNSLSAITSLPSAIPTDKIVLISTQTASNSSSISFTSGLNGTYDEYIFKLINVRCITDGAEFQFNMSTDGGSNYNVTKTSTWFQAYNDEATGSVYGIEYSIDHDLAQSTAFQDLTRDSGSDADQNLCGSLTIFNPSSTTYVKHYIAIINDYMNADYNRNSFTAGYGNTTSAINAVQFKMNSGNFDGTIKLYGVVKS